MPKLTHHGGHVGVTGSCHELHYGANASLLVDCGLFQGTDAKKTPSLEIEFPVAPVRAVMLTHAHIDHVGRLLYLLAAGYTGPFICSRPTARLLPLILEDALRLGFTRKRWLIAKVLVEIDQRLIPLDYNVWHRVDGDLRVRLQRAGHILGSAYVEVDTGGQRVVFSGDLGPPHTPLLYLPRSPSRAGPAGAGVNLRRSDARRTHRSSGKIARGSGEDAAERWCHDRARLQPGTEAGVAVRDQRHFRGSGAGHRDGEPDSRHRCHSLFTACFEIHPRLRRL